MASGTSRTISAWRKASSVIIINEYIAALSMRASITLFTSDLAAGDAVATCLEIHL